MRSLSNAATPLSALVDPQVGLIRGVRIIPPLQRYPRLWLAFALPTDARKLGALVAARVGGGIGSTEQSARSAALGETVERYCASFPPEETITATWETLAAEWEMLSPATFNMMNALPASGFAPISVDGTTRWVQGHFAHDGTPTLAPWSLICLGATPEARDEAEECFPGPSISTGLACAADMESAALRGLLECCERDAAMLAWYRRDFRGRVSGSLLGASWPYLHAELSRCRLRAHLLDVTTDIQVPSYICAITPEGSRERAAFGMASGLTGVAAAERALMESIHTWMWADSCRMGGDFATQLVGDPEFTDFDSRVVAYGCSLRRSALAIFFSAVEAAPVISEFRETGPKLTTYRELAQHLYSLGHPAVIVDVTTDDVRNAGYAVARSLTPTLQAMEAAHSLRIPNSLRLGTNIPKSFIDEPHPFP